MGSSTLRAKSAGEAEREPLEKKAKTFLRLKISVTRNHKLLKSRALKDGHQKKSGNDFEADRKNGRPRDLLLAALFGEPSSEATFLKDRSLSLLRKRTLLEASSLLSLSLKTLLASRAISLLPGKPHYL